MPLTCVVTPVVYLPQDLDNHHGFRASFSLTTKKMPVFVAYCYLGAAQSIPPGTKDNEATGFKESEHIVYAEVEFILSNPLIAYCGWDAVTYAMP
jgi:hypothetical protein